jgi:predicted cupin superfamily sugar epimerase
LNKDAARWIKKLKLEKHPEGGYFKQTYQSDLIVNIAGYEGPRRIATAIHYLLVGNEFSAFHRIKSDEMWHYYAGSSLTIYEINDGKLSKIKIGKGKREDPQFTIKANTWFAASLDDKSYCLLGCTVSPGFDYRDWELGNREELVRMYPQHKKTIERYTTV